MTNIQIGQSNPMLNGLHREARKDQGNSEGAQAGALHPGRVRSKFSVGQEVKKEILVEEVAP